MNCPACSQASTLQPLSSDLLGASQCPVCSGLWLSRNVFDATSVDHELVDTLKLLDHGQLDERSVTVKYRRCPDCGEPMGRRQYQGKGIVLDLCNADGFWFDSGELRKILSESSGANVVKKPRAKLLEADVEAVNAPLRPLDFGDGRLYDGNPSLRFKPFLRALMKAVKSF